MAEPLSAVASGIALWDQVKDAPQTISDLIERIDLIYPSIWDFERQCSQSGLPPMLWDSVTAAKSLAYCRKALQKVSDVVAELSTQITTRRGFRRKLVAVKVVLQKDELKRLEGQLRNAMEVLQFAQNAYTSAVLAATPDILALKLQQPMPSRGPSLGKSFEPEASFPEHREREDRQKPVLTDSRSVCRVERHVASRWKPSYPFGTLAIHTGPHEFGAAFRPPLWLAGLVSSFSLHMSIFRSSWDVRFCMYSERPRNDLIFRLVRRGNVKGLRSLFDQRKASPFDRDDRGWTLLHYALADCQLQVTKFLLGMGVDLNPIDRWGKVSQIGLADAEIYQSLLSPEWSTDPKTLCNEALNEHGFSLIDKVSRQLSYSQLDEFEITKQHEFTKNVMRMTTDLHPLQKGTNHYFLQDLPGIYVTPFLRLILWKMCWESGACLTMPKRTNQALRKWVGLLVEAGVDIEEYGKKEYDILRDCISESYISFGAGTRSWEEDDVEFLLQGCKLSFYGFTYGPNVKDWTVLCNEPTDQFAGEFWGLVEERPLDIPGAWFD
ncbi:hypothetical protein PG997_008987 [Apiospora hydei]|uniref:Ankyrin repeat protein n=1 Tax=Apiospora hydei TaxID=1337664 RepID=A0ABR1WG71_9PEZI